MTPTVYAISYPFVLAGNAVLPAFNISGAVTNVGPVSYFGGGKYYPPGTYTVTYLSGAISYIGDPVALNINGNYTTNCYLGRAFERCDGSGRPGRQHDVHDIGGVGGR